MNNLRKVLGVLLVFTLVIASCKKDEIATCSDGIKNGSETGIDCGGSCADCAVVASCTDGIQNGDETGVDCGGSCDACGSCNDGIQNGDETGVDCGGSCPACDSCNDGIQNGDETGIDCGGSCPDACPTCTDGIQNGNETGVDCGGSCPPCFTCGDNITDIDGNVYGTVEIGGVCWTTSNLKTTRYNDGTNIAASGWSNYANDAANNNVYGKLYTYNVANSGNLAPEGWHIPTKAEWDALIAATGGESSAGASLKSTSSLWNAPNTGATNSSGFTALPGGYDSGSFGHFDEGYFGYHWSTTQGTQSTQAWCVGLSNSDTQAWVQSYAKVWKMSVRCVKD